MLEENSSGFRQRNSVFCTIKKRDAEFLFQSFDLKRDRRLREVESFGSLSKVQSIGNCAEDLNPEIFHCGSSRRSALLKCLLARFFPNITYDSASLTRHSSRHN